MKRYLILLALVACNPQDLLNNDGTSPESKDSESEKATIEATIEPKKIETPSVDLTDASNHRFKIENMITQINSTGYAYNFDWDGLAQSFDYETVDGTDFIYITKTGSYLSGQDSCSITYKIGSVNEIVTSYERISPILCENQFRSENTYNGNVTWQVDWIRSNAADAPAPVKVKLELHGSTDVTVTLTASNNRTIVHNYTVK